MFPEDRGSCGKRVYTQLTFKQTELLINQYARGFINIGIKKGDRVSLFVRPCLEFMPIIFALYKIGAVVVLIDPGMGREGLLSCIERIAPRALVAIPQAMAATVLFPAKFKSVEIKVTVGNRTWLWGGHRIEDIRSDDGSSLGETTTTREDEASILFTSGSTGPAKGVRYTHGVFDAQTRQIKQMYDIQAGEIDLPCFPLFGLFSLAMGMTVVVPDMDPTKPAQADPKLLMEAIEDQGVSTLFASPALLKPFVSWCLKHQKFPQFTAFSLLVHPFPRSFTATFVKFFRKELRFTRLTVQLNPSQSPPSPQLKSLATPSIEPMRVKGPVLEI